MQTYIQRAKIQPNLVVIDFLNATLRFNSLKEIGIGTKIIELSNSFGALFPLYAYYPVYYREKQIERNKNVVRSPYVYLFAGGSTWWMDYDIFHLGINAKYAFMHYPGLSLQSSFSGIIAEWLLRKFPIMDIGAQIGLFYKSAYSEQSLGQKIDDNLGFYIIITLGSGSGF